MLWLVSAAVRAVPERIMLDLPADGPDQPVLAAAARLPMLIGRPAGQLALYARHGDRLEVVPFQIDPRDAEGRYIYETQGHEQIAAEDECVFMFGDLGPRPPAGDLLAASALAEIEVRTPGATPPRYAYLIAQPAPAARDYVQHRSATHAVETATYRVAFAPERPMQIVSLHWAAPSGYGTDLVDVMKLRHAGRFLGSEFTRSEADYRSRLVGVRDGPVRVLRRTLNHVHVFGPFRSPAVTVDFIAYARAFTAQVSVELPFRIGWLFDDLSARLTLDGSAAPGLPQHTLHTGTDRHGLPINGQWTSAKADFQTQAAGRFVLTSAAGAIAAGVLLEPDSPLTAQPFFADDLAAPDPPEQEIGQFGNLGFLINGWEKIDKRLHRMNFYVLMLPAADAEEGLTAAATWQAGLLKSRPSPPP